MEIFFWTTKIDFFLAKISEPMGIRRKGEVITSILHLVASHGGPRRPPQASPPSRQWQRLPWISRTVQNSEFAKENPDRLLPLVRHLHCLLRPHAQQQRLRGLALHLFLDRKRLNIHFQIFSFFQNSIFNNKLKPRSQFV